MSALKPSESGDAFPRGNSRYRQWLSRTWEGSLPKALAIGINPSSATDSNDDKMTKFLSEFLKALSGEYRCGGYMLVNCWDCRDSDPKNLKKIADPNSCCNDAVITGMLAACSFVVASWGTTKYGKKFEDRRNRIARMVVDSGKPAICFSPEGKPIYCSALLRNAGDGRWTDIPTPWKPPF